MTPADFKKLDTLAARVALLTAIRQWLHQQTGSLEEIPIVVAVANTTTAGRLAEATMITNLRDAKVAVPIMEGLITTAKNAPARTAIAIDLSKIGRA